MSEVDGAVRTQELRGVSSFSAGQIRTPALYMFHSIKMYQCRWRLLIAGNPEDC